jgi:hypothetical protein
MWCQGRLACVGGDMFFKKVDICCQGRVICAVKKSMSCVVREGHIKMLYLCKKTVRIMFAVNGVGCTTVRNNDCIWFGSHARACFTISTISPKRRFPAQRALGHLRNRNSN